MLLPHGNFLSQSFLGSLIWLQSPDGWTGAQGSKMASPTGFAILTSCKLRLLCFPPVDFSSSTRLVWISSPYDGFSVPRQQESKLHKPSRLGVHNSCVTGAILLTGKATYKASEGDNKLDSASWYRVTMSRFKDAEHKKVGLIGNHYYNNISYYFSPSKHVHKCMKLLLLFY